MKNLITFRRWLAILFVSLAFQGISNGQTLYTGAPQIINSTSLGTTTINDYTRHSYSFPSAGSGTFRDCKITRYFAAPIQSITLSIDSGEADDIGYVGTIQVTNTGTCSTAAFVSNSVDVTTQVTIHGDSAIVTLRAKENCCCVTGWGLVNSPGGKYARFHWIVTLCSNATFYADTDGDGYGNLNATTQACTQPSGYVSNNTDCNDANAEIHPGVVETCNNLDDNCDGITDNASATTLTIQWQKAVGGSGNNDVARHIKQTSDGGFIVAGETNSNDGDVTGLHGINDAFAAKLTSTGSLSWLKAVGGTQMEKAYSADQGPDASYFLVGTTASNDGDISGNHGGNDFLVSKLNQSGALQWTKALGGSGNDNAYGVIATSDNGCIVVGGSNSTDGNVSNAHGNQDGWIIKLNSSGAIEWQKTYGGTGQEELFDIKATSDNGYILAGYSFGNNGDVTGVHGSDDYWILKIDGAGNVQWSKLFGGLYADEAYSVQQTSDSGYVAMGFSTSNDGNVSGHHGASNGTTDYWVLRLDAAGNIVWQKSLGGTDSDFGYAVSQTSDNGFIVSGSSRSTDGDVAGNHGGYDMWVVKLNSLGSITANNSYGGTSDDGSVSSSVQETFDGGYAIAGNTSSINGDVTGNHGPSDAWVIKLSGGACPVDADGDGYTVAQGDCNDADEAIHPNAVDLCNGIDDNCNGVVDENAIIATITPSGTVTVCNGTSVTLTANTGAGIFYQWKKGSTNIAGATNSTYTTTKANSYKVIETNSFGCSSTSAVTTIVLNSLPSATIMAPNGTDLCPTGSVLLQTNSGTGLTYQWIKGSVNQVGATNQTYTATKAATYKVKVTNSSGCSKTSSGTKVTKSCKEGEAVDEAILSQFSIYPNPTNGNFTIDLKFGEVLIANASLEVMNILGQVIYTKELSVNGYELMTDVTLDHSLDNGMYWVMVVINDKIFSKQLAIQK